MMQRGKKESGTVVNDGGDDGSETNTSNKQQQLNRFLSKTYHMVNSDDSNLVCWAPGGESFLILDAAKFSETVLPKYFKHSKISSFIRQLNFYGFRKIRNTGSTAALHDDDNEDDDSETGQPTTSTGTKKQPVICRFYHEFFQANRPELLYRIQRATKSAEPPSPGQIESLRYQVAAMKERMDTMQTEFDSKMQKMKTTIEHDYQRRFAVMEASYKDLLTHVLRDRIGGGSFPAAAANSAAALRSAALASMAGMPDSSFTGIGPAMPSSLMLSSLNRPTGGGGVYSSTSGGMQTFLRNTNPTPGPSDLSPFGMLGKFR